MKYNIQVNPLNPVEYLACCGVFEILARFDANAISWWELESQPSFWLESEIDEASLLACLTQALSDWSQWQAEEKTLTAEEAEEGAEEIFDDNEKDGEESSGEEESESNEGILLCPRFSLNDKTVCLTLDWWYETLTPQKKIKAKSAWKMYAGQQTAEKISRDMTTKAAQLLKENSIVRLTDIIKLSTGMTGRFGFDPRSSRNALDAGYSANDLKLPIATYPFAEMLTAIATQHFFPQRNQPSAGITSSRGWVKNDIFQYALWKTSLPITLARVAAIGAAINKDDVILLQAERANRDKYSNFKMATMTVWKDKELGAIEKPEFKRR
jgi:CRISPR-associated protein Csb3